MLNLFHFSAKELEHYHRVRQTFEGPSKAPPISNHGPSLAVHGHLETPVLSKRPQMKSRTSTAKPKASPEPKGKGKGKATNWNSDDDDDDDDDDAYVTSNDFASTPKRRASNTNGSFGEAGDDDDELYP